MVDISLRKVKVDIEVGDKTQTFTLRNASGKEFSHLWNTIRALGKIDFEGDLTEKENTQELLEALDTNTMESIRKLAVATFMASYPDKDEELVESFVTQNLFEFLGPVIEVNTPTSN